MLPRVISPKKGKRCRERGCFCREQQRLTSCGVLRSGTAVAGSCLVLLLFGESTVWGREQQLLTFVCLEVRDSVPCCALS